MATHETASQTVGPDLHGRAGLAAPIEFIIDWTEVAARLRNLQMATR